MTQLPVDCDAPSGQSPAWSGHASRFEMTTAAPPRVGNGHRAHPARERAPESGGRTSSARKTSPSSSTTPASSSCPGSTSPTSAPTSSPSSDASGFATGPPATTPPPCSSRPSASPALYRRRLPRLRVDTRRHHQGARVLCTYNRHDKPQRDIWLRPLRRNWKAILNRCSRPSYRHAERLRT